MHTKSSTSMDQEPDRRLPVELQDHIFSDFVSGEPDYSSKRDFRNALLSFSLVSHYFRSLALPYLFKSFFPAFELRKGRPWFSAFCHAWTTGDKHALALIPHIQHCILDIRAHRSGEALDTMATISHTGAYLAAVQALPNLSSLSVCAPLKLSLLQQLLQVRRIKTLSFVDSYAYTDENPTSIDAPINIVHFLDLANAIATHAKDLQTLNMRDCVFFHHLLALPTSFPLTTLRIREITISDMEAFRGFVSSIPTLKELSIYHGCSLERPDFEPGDLPNLEHLICPRDWCSAIIDSACLTKLRSLIAYSGYLGTEQLTFDEASEETFHRTIQVFCGKSLRSLVVPVEFAYVCCGPHLPYLEKLTITLSDKYPYADHDGVYPNSSELAWYWAKNIGYGYCNIDNTEGSDSQPPGTNDAAIWGHLTHFGFDYNMHHSPFSKSSFPFNLVEQRRLIAGSLKPRFTNIRAIQLSPWVSWALSARGNWIPSVKLGFKRHFVEALHAFENDPPSDAPQNWTWRDWDVMQCLERLMMQ